MIVAMELCAILGAAILAIFWVLDPSGNYEPFTVLLGLVGASMEVYRRLKRKSHKETEQGFTDKILSAYRNQLISSLQHIPLRGIDTETSDPYGKPKRLELDQVYVGLDTTSQIELTPVEKKKAKADYFQRDRDSRPLSALEAAASNQSLVILGDPGSGKSTFVNHLTICLSRNDYSEKSCDLDSGWPKSLTDLIPIPIVMRDFAQWISEIPEKAEARHLWDFIVWRLKSQMLAGAADIIEDALNNGKAIVLPDGIDEIPTPEKRTFIRDAVAAFAERYPGSRFIVTCRVLSYQNREWRLDEKDFPVFELAAFDEHKIDAFIRAWYEDLRRLNVVKTQEETDELVRRLKTAVRRPDLWQLASNPLLLTVMALVHTHKSRLPDARALLYEETVEILLWRWEQVKRGDRKSKPGLKELLLEVGRMEVDLKKALWKLAFEAHGKSEHTKDDQGETVADIHEWELSKAFARLHPEKSLDWAARVIEIIKLRAGLLLERSPEVYTFPHRTFQEYLAGAYLSTQADFAKRASSLIESGNFWREVVLLAVGRLVYVSADSDKPLALVGEFCPAKTADNEVSWRKVWTAGDALVEIGMNRVKDSRLGKDLLERLRTQLTDLLQTGRLTPKERVAAGNSLSHLGDPRFDPDNWYLPVGDDMGFITIPAGTFLMGSDQKKDSKADDNEFPQHPVELSKYAIGKYPVTVAAFQAFVQDSGYGPEGKWEAYAEYANHPVVNVTWNDAMKYCEWLTEKLKDRGMRIKLPTEAQWEKAARGTDGRIYPCGNELGPDHANTAITQIYMTSPVGSFPEDVSPYKCLDMTGNIAEWCRDWYEESYDANSPSIDPAGPDTGVFRVGRGGSWGDVADNCRSANRSGHTPISRTGFLGFRLASFPGQSFWRN